MRAASQGLIVSILFPHEVCFAIFDTNGPGTFVSRNCLQILRENFGFELALNKKKTLKSGTVKALLNPA